MTDNLKPCPFCGETMGEPSDNGLGVIFHVRCKKCRAAGPGERCAADAISAWNKRLASLPTVSVEARNAVIEECANIAEAIDSGRGNEAEIANAIRRLKSLPTPPEKE